MDSVIIKSSVRKLVHSQGKRSTALYEEWLNRKVTSLIVASCKVHNGGRATLEPVVGEHAGRGLFQGPTA